MPSSNQYRVCAENIDFIFPSFHLMQYCQHHSSYPLHKIGKMNEKMIEKNLCLSRRKIGLAMSLSHSVTLFSRNSNLRNNSVSLFFCYQVV